MAIESRTSTYVTRLVHGTVEDAAAAFDAVLAEGRPASTPGRIPLVVTRAETPPPPPGTRYWTVRRYVGRLRVGGWRRHAPVELELTPSSDAAIELGVRYCGRVRPGERYYGAADTVLVALAFDVEARLAVEGLSRFLEVVASQHDDAANATGGRRAGPASLRWVHRRRAPSKTW